MLKKLLILLLWVGWLLQGTAQAQTSYALRIVAASKDSTMRPDRLGLKRTFPDRLACFKYVNDLTALLQAEGYIAASIDSVHFDSTFARIVLYSGRKYQEDTFTFFRQFYPLKSRH